MFAADIEANKDKLTQEIKDKQVCVIGGAGSIGSSFIKAVLRFEPKSVVVVDLNENGLAELVRDVWSTEGLLDRKAGNRSSPCLNRNWARNGRYCLSITTNNNAR